MKFRPAVLCLIVLLLCAGFTNAAAIGIEDWLADHDASLWVDPLLGTLTFRRDESTLVIPPGQTWGVYNNDGRVLFPDLVWKGSEPVFSPAMLEALTAVMDPPPPPAAEGERRITTIFIDPGHGGRDPGSISRRGKDKTGPGLQEKDLALDVSLRLRELLRKAYPGIRIVMSRDTDVFLSLEERTRKANAYARGKDQSVVYVSVHANASLNTRANGFEVWYLPGSTRRQVVQPGVYDVDKSVLPLVNDLVQEEIANDSYLLANSISRGLERSVGSQSRNRGTKEEEWYVVRNSWMPAVLVEIGFITNPEEFELLANPAYLQKLAQGIYSGMVGFMGDYQVPAKKR